MHAGCDHEVPALVHHYSWTAKWGKSDSSDMNVQPRSEHRSTKKKSTASASRAAMLNMSPVPPPLGLGLSMLATAVASVLNLAFEGSSVLGYTAWGDMAYVHNAVFLSCRFSQAQLYTL